MLSSAGRLGFDLLDAAKWIDIFLAACSIIAFYILVRTTLGDQLIALVAAIAFSVNIWLVRWAATGMETSLSVFLVLLTSIVLLRRNYPAAGFATGLLALT